MNVDSENSSECLDPRFRFEKLSLPSRSRQAFFRVITAVIRDMSLKTELYNRTELFRSVTFQ